MFDSLPAIIKNLHIISVIRVSEDLIRQNSRVQKVSDASNVRPNTMDLTITQFRLVLRNMTI